MLSTTWAGTLNELCTRDYKKKTPFKRIVAIVGPKNVGKSTFARELCRRWQATFKGKERVALLDTDLGRPEFTLPGMVSVHSFTMDDPMQHKLEGAIFLGEDDPSVRPETYIQTIERLSQSALANFDLICVNTHGWFAGLGQDVLEAVLLSVKATDVVQIIPENKILSLGSLLKQSTEFTIWTLVPAKEGRQRESKSSRERRFVEHFTRGVMHAVGLKRVRIRYPHGIIDHALPPRHALLALNASIVGLSKGEDETDPENFLGLGLVCSVDPDRELIYVQTPVKFEELQYCRVLTCATSVRVPLGLFPMRFKPEKSGDEKIALEDFELAQDEDVVVPYLSSCKLVGFGSIQPHRGVLKRRRLDDSAA